MLLLYSKSWTLSRFITFKQCIGDVIAAVEDPKKGELVDWFDSDANWGHIFYRVPGLR